MTDARRQLSRSVRAVAQPAEIAAAMALVALFAACALCGGSARPDAASLVLLRPVVVICLFILLAVPGPRDWEAVRPPLILLAAFASTMAIQLVPLPPTIVDSLPGHARFREAFVLSNSVSDWRTISVTPDRTWNSLIALLVPLTVLIAFARLPSRWRVDALLGLVLLAMGSGLLGLLQLLGGPQSALYFYHFTHLGFPVGFFANRNHEAALLDMALPAASAWAQARPRGGVSPAARYVVAAGCTVFLIPMVLVTGSRAGLGLMPISVIWAALLWLRRGPLREQRTALILLGGGAALAMVFGAISIALGRTTAITRVLTGPTVASDARFDYAELSTRIARASFPLGFGFGSFDPVFRSFEPDSLLRVTYANNAHNDLLELAVCGGVPALLVLAALLIWWARRAWVSTRLPAAAPGVLRARAAVAMVGIVLLASLSDYPLRTPLMAAVLALVCAWMAPPGEATS